MITIPHHVLGREVELERVTVTTEMIAAYARAVGDAATLAGPRHEAPPTFCLTLPRSMTPNIALPPGFFGVYGGHDLDFNQPIRAGHTYRVTARVAEVFEKSGRSGSLTVVVREATIRDEQGQLVVCAIEQEIIRCLPTSSVPERENGARVIPLEQFPSQELGSQGRPIGLGDELGPLRRHAPAAGDIAAYITGYIGADNIGEFTAHARAVGLEGIVVPGPMLAAFLEQFVRREFPRWRVQRLTVTFRVPTIAGTALVLRGAVTEHHEAADGERLVCDLVIEHGDGERAVTGSATVARLADSAR